MANKGRENLIKKKVGAVDPLKGLKAHTEKSQFMFQVSFRSPH